MFDLIQNVDVYSYFAYDVVKRNLTVPDVDIFSSISEKQLNDFVKGTKLDYQTFFDEVCYSNNLEWAARVYLHFFWLPSINDIFISNSLLKVSKDILGRDLSKFSASVREAASDGITTDPAMVGIGNKYEWNNWCHDDNINSTQMLWNN